MDLAELWGVSLGFVRDQVRDGKLHATVQLPSGRRTIYRFTAGDIMAYDHTVTRERLARLRRKRADGAEHADDKRPARL